MPYYLDSPNLSPCFIASKPVWVWCIERPYPVIPKHVPRKITEALNRVFVLSLCHLVTILSRVWPLFVFLLPVVCHHRRHDSWRQSFSFSVSFVIFLIVVFFDIFVDNDFISSCPTFHNPQYVPIHWPARSIYSLHNRVTLFAVLLPACISHLYILE